MNIVRTIFSICLCIAATIVYCVPSIHAQSENSFPHCLNPSGTIVAHYLSGVHAVAGDEQVYTGSDIVYQLSDTTLTQCMCSVSGAGIQTNWIKSDSLSIESRQQYISAGWTPVIDGSAWGLAQGEYLAKNSYYSCIGGAGGGDPTSHSNPSSSGEPHTSSSSSSQTNIMQATHILAGTGSSKQITFYLAIGLLFMLSGVALSNHRAS